MYYQYTGILLVVRFLNDTSSAVESEGSILFTVISLVQSDNPFTVQVCTRESDLFSAEGLLYMHNTKSQTLAYYTIVVLYMYSRDHKESCFTVIKYHNLTFSSW